MADINQTTDDKARVIMLTFGHLEQGGMYWCYVAVKPTRYEEFKKLTGGKQYNIQNFVADGFGEIVVSGEGSLPPKEVTQQVAEIFGVPIKQLFADIDPLSEIAKELAKIHPVT